MEICKHYGDCGGCIYQGIPYDEQVELKGRQVLMYLQEQNVKWEEFLGIEGSPSQYEYRNKMEYTFGDEVKGGELTLGLHRQGRFMSIITTDHCQIVDQDFNIILKGTLDFAREKGYPFYHKKSHEGLLRNLVLRKGVRTGELLINIVTASHKNGSSSDFDEEGYLSMIRGLPLKNRVVGILRTFNDRLGDGVNCDHLKVLEGRDYYMEEIMGLKFKVSAFSFFQTNVEAVERLYTEALSLIGDVTGKRVFDLYCGTGTITQAVAMHAGQAIGVELNGDSVAAARENAQLNGLENCRFIEGDVLKVLNDIEGKPDVIVVDPPRAGIAPKAMGKILDYRVDQILYISCNPKTMAENLVAATERGYKVSKIKAYDNFPMTRHVECVVLMSRVEK
ncbi:MAG: 23S rRNA (uracil(1939)-C(5))-methyltransferase RlmD [Anaerovoracaceae bacterium]